MAKPADSPAMPADAAKGQHGDYLSTRWSHTAKYLRELTSRKAALAEEIRRKRAAIQVFGEEEREALLVASPFTVSAYLYQPDGAVQQTSASLPLLQTMSASVMTSPKSPAGKPTAAKANIPLATSVSAPSPSLDVLLQSVLQRSTAVSSKLVKSCALSKEGADKPDMRGNNPGLKKGNSLHSRSYGNLMAKNRQSRRQRSQNMRNGEEEDERSTTPESHVSSLSQVPVFPDTSRNPSDEGALPDLAPAGQPQPRATDEPAPRAPASMLGDEQGPSRQGTSTGDTQESAAPEGPRPISSGSRLYGSRRPALRSRRTPSRSMDGDRRNSLPGSTAPRSTSAGVRSAADCSDQQAGSDSAPRGLHLPRLGQGVGGKAAAAAAALLGADRDTVGGVEAGGGKSASHSACGSNASSGTDTGGDRDTSRRTTPASRASRRSSNVFALPPSGRSPWAKSTTARDLVFITRF